MERKRGKKRWRKLLAAGAILLVLSVGKASSLLAAEQDQPEIKGSIQITLRELDAENSAAEGVEFSLWKVGSVDAYGTPHLEEEWGIKEYPQDSESLDKAAHYISSLRLGEPEQRGKTDSGGQILFPELDPGIYLIKADAGNPYGKLSPFLVQLPYWEEVNGQMEGPVYAVKMEPKASPYPEETEKEDQSSKADEDVVKTGNWENPERYFVIMAAAFLVGYGVKRKSDRDKKAGGDGK